MAKRTPTPDSPGPNPLQWATLAGVVLVGALSVRNMQAITGVQQSIDSRIQSIDARVGKMQSDVANAAVAARKAQQPARTGLDPNQVYAIKPAPAAMVHGNPSAPITIVEVSDFQ